MKRKKFRNRWKMKWKNATCRSLVSLLKVVTIVQCLLYQSYALALEQTSLVKGGKRLIEDATTVALLIEAGLIIFLEIKTGIGYQNAEAEEKPKYKKEAKSILMVGVLIVCATSIIKVILSYFTATGV